MSERSNTRVPLSVLVPVKNEAVNLCECLAGVSFADEIVVVDSASTDGTQEIATAAGARVVQFVWNGKFPRKKNWALENIPWRHEWVLIIDADERITPGIFRAGICFYFGIGSVDTKGLKSMTMFDPEIMRCTNTYCSMAAQNIFPLRWSIMRFPMSPASLRNTIAIPRGKPRCENNCIKWQARTLYERRRLERRWSAS